MNKATTQDNAIVASLRSQLDETLAKVVRLNASVHHFEKEAEEKIQEIFELKEKLMDANQVVEAAERQLQADAETIKEKEGTIEAVKCSPIACVA